MILNGHISNCEMHLHDKQLTKNASVQLLTVAGTSVAERVIKNQPVLNFFFVYYVSSCLANLTNCCDFIFTCFLRTFFIELK
jgi:hypothetical protein